MSKAVSPEFLADYASVLSTSGHYQLQNWSFIQVSGSDRVSFLHNMCTADLKKLSAGQTCESFFTDVKGKIIAHTIVIAGDQNHVLLAVPEQAEKIITHLDRYIIREDVELHDHSNTQTCWLLLGKNAESLLTQCECLDLKTSFDSLANPATLVSTKLDNAEAMSTWLNDSDSQTMSEDVWNALRIESGLPLFGVDFDSSHLPQEVNRDAIAISFTKGCYLGQETVARIDALGHVNKKLVGLQFGKDEIPESETKLFCEEKEVGRITSACWSPHSNSPLALAMIQRGANEVGQVHESDAGQATVVSLAP